MSADFDRAAADFDHAIVWGRGATEALASRTTNLPGASGAGTACSFGPDLGLAILPPRIELAARRSKIGRYEDHEGPQRRPGSPPRAHLLIQFVRPRNGFHKTLLNNDLLEQRHKTGPAFTAGPGFVSVPAFRRGSIAEVSGGDGWRAVTMRERQ